MNTRSDRPLLVLAVAGLVGLGLLALGRATSSDNESPATDAADAPKLSRRAAFTAATAVSGSACAFVPGQRMAYEVESETSVELDLGVLTEAVELGANTQLRASEAKTHSTRRSWRLELEAIARDDDGSSVLAARIEDHGSTPAPSPGLSETFLLRVDPRCGVREFGWRSDGELDAAREQQMLAAGLGFWAPTDPSSAGTYGGTSFDMTGRYAAGFHYDGAGEISGRVESYAVGPGIAHGLTVALEVLSSNIEVELGTGVWFESLVNERDLELTHAGTPFGAHYRKTTAQRSAPRQFAARVDLDDGGWSWGILSGKAGEAEDPIDDALRGVPLDDALARYRELIAEGDVGKYTQLLREWLRANPEGAALLRERLETGDFDEEQEARSGVFYALGSADTSECRTALLALVGESRPANRISAAQALALTREPSIEMVEVLADATLGEQLHPIERGSIALALGSLARTSEAHAPEVAAAAREQIAGWLAQADDEQQLGASLLAAGNAGHDSLVPEIAPYLDHDSSAIRRDATRALRHMSPEQALPHLETRIADDDQQVRTTALETATSVARTGDQAPPSTMIDAAAGALDRAEADGELRAAIDLLGVAAQHGDARADELLREQLQAELRASNRDLDRVAALGRSTAGHWSAD